MVCMYVYIFAATYYGIVCECPFTKMGRESERELLLVFFSFLFLLLHFLLSTIFLFTFLISEKSCVCATVENCVTVKVKDYENWYYGFIRISTLTAVSCCTIEIPLVSFVGKWHAYEGLRC